MDEFLFGWDETPSIVSVWASRDGRAAVWLRDGELVTCARERFRPWLFAANNELQEDYYRVGPVEQYLIQSWRVYFRGLAYDVVHRLQFDLETTALDPHRGCIFMVAVRDSKGLALTLDAPLV